MKKKESPPEKDWRSRKMFFCFFFTSTFLTAAAGLARPDWLSLTLARVFFSTSSSKKDQAWFYSRVMMRE